MQIATMSFGFLILIGAVSFYAVIDAGVQTVIVHWDENGTTPSQEAYNLENISLSDWQKEQLARATLEACRRFYSDPENVKKYEAWKAERDETKKRK